MLLFFLNTTFKYLTKVRTACNIIFLCAFFFIISALYFQYGLGLQPCPLCRIQQGVYGFIFLIYLIPFLRCFFSSSRQQKRAPHIFLTIMVLSLGFGLVVAFYQMGGEYKWWSLWKPLCSIRSTGQSIETLHTELLATTNLISTKSCAIPPWRFLTLSMAGWNVIVSGLLLFYGVLSKILKYKDLSASSDARKKLY